MAAKDLSAALSFTPEQPEKLVEGYIRRTQPTLDAPVQAFSVWDSVQLVQSALNELENGNFKSAALLCDATNRDERITAVFDARINGVLSLPLTFEPGIKENDKAAKAAEELEASWTSMFPECEITKLLKWGRIVGIAPGELVWKNEKRPEGTRWTPTLQVWDPQFVYWNWTWRDYAILTQEDGIQKMGDKPGQWFVYSPKGRYLAWKTGLIRALAIIFLIRWWAYRDWARYSEKHGLPIVKAIVPKGADKQVKDQYFGALAMLGTENTIKCEQGGKGEAKFDAELLEPTANTWAGFKALIEQCDSSIAILVLGQNLTTEVKGGSYAAAGVHERVRADFLHSDAETLSSFLREQVLKPWAAFNFGDPELAPWPVWQTDAPENAKDVSQSGLTAGQALTALRGADAPVDEREFLQGLGIPLLSEEEWKRVKGERQKEAQEKLKAQQAVLPVAEPPAQPPAAPGKTPKKGNESAEPKAELPPEELLAALRALPITGWDEETVVARAKVIAQLGIPLEQPQAAAKPKRDAVPAGQVRAQVFADDLSDDAAAAGAAALGPDLTGVLDDISAAKSYEDLRARLLSRLKGMDRQDVAEVIERATMLAHSAGQLGVVEANEAN